MIAIVLSLFWNDPSLYDTHSDNFRSVQQGNDPEHRDEMKTFETVRYQEFVTRPQSNWSCISLVEDQSEAKKKKQEVIYFRLQL